jgi:hypothetical protein
VEGGRFTVGGAELRAAVRIARGLVASDLGIKTVDELELTSAVNEVLGDRTDVEAIAQRLGGVLLALGLVIQTGAEFGGYSAGELLDALEEVADNWEQRDSAKAGA